MELELEKTLAKVSRSKPFREALGRLVTFPASKDDFLIDPPAAVQSMNLQLDEDQIACLKQVLESLDGLSRETALELQLESAGADKLIK